MAAPSSAPRSSRRPSHPNATSSTTYDIVWERGALGLLFTPNGDEEPVICQLVPDQLPSAARPHVQVGDVVVAVQSPSSPFEAVESVEHLVHVLTTEALPITLRCRSRATDPPEPIYERDVAYSYSFVWPEGRPLGVSLAMDPCTLHTVITAVDETRCAPEFLRMQPEIGDMLVRVSSERDRARIPFDEMRFDRAVQELRTFPRPCKLAFVRMQQDWGTSRSRQDSSQGTEAGAPPSTSSRRTSNPPPERHPLPAPLTHRESISIRRSDVQPLQPTGPTSTSSSNEDRFYTITYSGGAIGLLVKDAGRRGRTKKNGYYLVVKEVTDPHAVPGIEHALPGDELIAIDHRDLKDVSFDEIQFELGRIRTPTALIFQHRLRNGGDVSVTSTLLDALFFALV